LGGQLNFCVWSCSLCCWSITTARFFHCVCVCFMSCFRTIFTHASFVLIDSNEIGDKNKNATQSIGFNRQSWRTCCFSWLCTQHFTCLLPLFFVGDSNEIHQQRAVRTG
jgi:hypothetical protein